MQSQPVVFSKPCNSDFVFFRIFCVFLIVDRRPFCSQRKLLNNSAGLRLRYAGLQLEVAKRAVKAA